MAFCSAFVSPAIVNIAAAFELCTQHGKELCLILNAYQMLSSLYVCSETATAAIYLK